MPIAIDQTQALVTKAGTAGLTLDITFGTLPAVGSLVLVPISLWFQRTGPLNNYTSVVDNQGNGTYSVVSQPSGTGLQAQTYLAYARALTSSGTFTITLTFNLNGGGLATEAFIQMGAVSFTGLTGALDRTDGNVFGDGANPAVTAFALTTAATSTANELVMAVLHCQGSDPDIVSAQNASGYTNLFKDDAENLVTAHRTDYQIVSAIGEQTTNWSFDSSRGSGLIATFVGPSSSPMFRGS